MKDKYKKEQHWCSNCDKQIVTAGKKCPLCGIRESGTKIKKKTIIRKILLEEN